MEQIIGTDAANSLMALLPFQPADELATRSDVAAATSVLRGEMAELRSELRGEMAELRGEMAELRGDLVGFRGELKGDFYRWGAAVVGANTIAMITALVT
jgi:hypothetical protein